MRAHENPPALTNDFAARLRFLSEAGGWQTGFVTFSFKFALLLVCTVALLQSPVAFGAASEKCDFQSDEELAAYLLANPGLSHLQIIGAWKLK